MKMHATFFATVLAAALAAPPAIASATTIDFESVSPFASIGNTYAGVSFGPDAQGLVNDALGPYFSNAPSPLGVMFVSGTGVPDAAMTVAAGFTQLSLFYSSADAVADAVQVWSGANGTGNLIASFNLLVNATNGCSDSAYCRWDTLSGVFAVKALSITFGAGTQAAAFDNISVVPEPASALLLGLGLAALVVSRRRD